MKYKVNKKYLYALAAIITIALVLFYLKTRREPLEIKRCVAEINEEIESENISAQYQRVVSVAGEMAFVKDTGIIHSDAISWRLNRNYTFSLKKIRKDTYSYEKISMYSSQADNVPDTVVLKMRPDTIAGIKLVHVEEVQPKTWIFSGLLFPLFSCKQK